ncbi:MAG: type I secretion system permease/ATPase [Magnetococcales bacterium]|nr:type I secretion system permease/ATPase [Magnetococcales bacterium]
MRQFVSGSSLLTIKRGVDPLLECLAVVLRHLGEMQTPESLLFGLPMPDDGMSPTLFKKAAQNVGAVAQLVEIPLSTLNDMTLPCVLLLKNRQACVLVGFDVEGEEKKQVARLVFPETDPGVVSQPIEKLAEKYTGRAFFVHKKPISERPVVGQRPQQGHEWFWKEVRQHSPIFKRLVLASIVINLLTLVGPIFVMNVYDRVIPNMAVETLFALVIGVCIAYLFDFSIKILRYQFIDATGRNLDTLLSSKIFAKLLSLPLEATPVSEGGMANQVRSFDGLREFFSSATMTTFIDLPFAFLFIGMIAHLGGGIAFIPGIIAFIVIVTGLILQSSLMNFMRSHFRQGTQKNGLLVESLQMLETIKVLGAEGEVQKEWDEYVDSYAESAMKERRLAFTFVSFVGLLAQASYVATITAGVFAIATGDLTMGGLIACSILSGRVMAPLMQTANILSRMQQSRVTLSALGRLMSMPSERMEGRRFTHLDGFNGEIEFRNVVFRHLGQKKPALAGVSFILKPGERVGIIGGIGSGKSTMVKLIQGLYSPQNGSVLVDGVDVSQLDPAELRRAISYTPQDVQLFSGTIRNNITRGKRFVTDEAIWSALALTGFDRAINAHPMGLERPVGSHGRFLSGGEKQSIILARTFIEHRSIILLDEPTSSLDLATEQALVRRLQEKISNQTIMIITQRAPILSLIDRLLVMEHGQLVADGPRDLILDELRGGRIGQGVAM